MYFHEQIKTRAQRNRFFRQEIFTGEKAQITLMSLKPNEDIGAEVHPNTDQILFFVEGRGKAYLDGREEIIEENDLLYIEHGAEHNVVNTSAEEMKIVSVYIPPEHPRGTVHETKAEAEAAEH